jgi:hypothetical protein
MFAGLSDTKGGAEKWTSGSPWLEAQRAASAEDIGEGAGKFPGTKVSVDDYALPPLPPVCMGGAVQH